MNTTTEKKTGMAQGSQMRITEREIELIKRTFAEKPELIKLLRKIFLPELDPVAPIGQMIDLWMTVKSEGLSMEEQLINLKARNSLISHVDSQLMTLELISKMPDVTPEEKDKKAKLDSSK